MSFDTINNVVNRIEAKGLNPFRAGRCLSTQMLENAVQRTVSLNPFRAGRCLSTSY